MHHTTIMLAAVLTLFIVSLEEVKADFIVMGQIESLETSYLGFKGTMRRVDAMSVGGGNMHTITDRFESVSEHKGLRGGNVGRCWIRLKTDGLGLISDAVNMFKELSDNVVFYELQEDGTYDPIDAENLTFPCRKG